MLKIHLIPNKVYTFSLKTKLCLIVSFAVALVGFCSLFTLSYVKVQRDQLSYSTLAHSLSYSVDKIETTLTIINKLAGIISNSSSIQESLSILNTSTDEMKQSASLSSINKELLYYNHQFQYISNISIITPSHIPSSNGMGFSQEWPHLQSRISNQMFTLEPSINWHPSSLSNATLICTKNIFKDSSLSESLGVLFIRVDIAELISDTLNFSSQFEQASFILVDQSTPIYASEPLFNADLYALLIRARKPYYIIDLAGTTYFTVIQTLESFNWNYICLVPYSYVFGVVESSYVFFLLIIILSILIVISLSQFFIRAITKDLSLLVQKIQSFRGNYEDLVPTPKYHQYRTDELAIIHKYFDKMATDILSLIQDNYTKQLLLKEAEFKSLEQQINPHFLYNTLESINWRAKFLKEPQISQMVESLGKLLRMSLSEKSDIISLSKELDFIHNYLTIQQIRFEDRLIFELNLQNNLEPANLTLPKMSIQPLIENAIKYGVEHAIDSCQIILSISTDNNLLIIKVINSGSEFPSELLTNLHFSSIHSKGCGLGLLNIDTRVKLTYGNIYGLSLTNLDDAVCVTLKLPL